MVEYFATKGKLILKNNEPVVFIDGSEKSFLQEELILWTTLHWNFLNKHGVIGKVICYPEQEQMVRSYFGKRIIIQKVDISVIEKILDVDMRGLFYEE